MPSRNPELSAATRGRRRARLIEDSIKRYNPELSAAKRASASGAMRKRLATLKATRSTGRFTPPKLKPIRRIGKRPPIRGGALVPPVGSFLQGAITIGRDVLRGGSGPTIVQGAGSQMVAATKDALRDLNRQRAAQGVRPFDFPGRRGPLGGSSGIRRAIRPVSRPRGGSARAK